MGGVLRVCIAWIKGGRVGTVEEGALTVWPMRMLHARENYSDVTLEGLVRQGSC